MIERLKTGWNIQRFLFSGIGAFVFFDSIQSQEWLGVLLGGYFLYMGLFAKGCASNACYPIRQKETTNAVDVEWEEVK